MLRARVAYSLALLLAAGALSAREQDKPDSLVRLLGCDLIQQVEQYGQSYRKALGNARFEHNSTLLLCDTALWNVNTNIIHAFGHVRIIQNETVLNSDKLDYFIDRDLAEFRGTLVQLQDKDRNMLRTRYLDYNTKDSVAVFKNGAALRDKDGQIIESDYGSYDSKAKLFKFVGNVNMFTDTIFVKTESLDYDTREEMAWFGKGTHAWREENMLSSSAGWYNHREEIFLFYRDVHVMTRNQEGWADSLKYYRTSRNAEMFGNARILDTSRNVAAVAGRMSYNDSLSRIVMTRNPAVIAVSVQKEKRDTAYVGADTLVYWTIPRCDLDSAAIRGAQARLEEVNADPVLEYRRKTAEAARAAAEEARKKMEEEDPSAAGSVDRGRAGAGRGRAAAGRAGNAGASRSGSTGPLPEGGIAPNLPGPSDEQAAPPFLACSFAPQPPDTLARQDTLTRKDTTALPGAGASPAGETPQDTLALAGASLSAMSADSLGARADTVDLAPKDSTKVGFLLGRKNVKVFRRDMQVVCDSLAYTDLDSLVRLYQSPVIWNEVRRQYSADSIFVIIRNQVLDRASLMSNAFIIVQEDTLSYDQVKGTDMMAYFDSTGALRRFDALGGASGLFYIEENDALATVNKFESKMLTAAFRNGNIQELHYFEAVKSDAYPVVQMKKDEKLLKGYDWQPDKRPKDPGDVTAYKPRAPERAVYEAVPRAGFPQTDLYFPGYMESVHKMLAQQDSIKQVRRAERQRAEAEKARIADSLRVASADSLRQNQLADSLKVPAAADTLQQGALSGTLPANPGLRPETDSLPEGSAGRQGPEADTLVLGRRQLDSLAAGTSLSAFDRERAEKKARKAAKDSLRAEKERIRQGKFSVKESEWARLDSLDAAKAKVKAERALKRRRVQTLKTLKALEKREAREQRVMERYKARFERRKARQEARKARKASPGKPVPDSTRVAPTPPAEPAVSSGSLQTEFPAEGGNHVHGH